MPTAPTGYWWVTKPNFGDLLTPLLMRRFARVELTWAPKEEADLVCVGSVLEHLPPDWSGIIAGAGQLKRQSVISLPNATVLAVRGPLTAKNFTGDFVLGDPGLLADELILDIEKKHELGLVPHWTDTQLTKRPEFLRYDPQIIRPDGDPLKVLRQIGECRKIVSSSLHGIIVADAFGIPRRTEMAAAMSKHHEGGTFKFEDYNASIGCDFEVGKTQEPSRYLVQDRQHELFDMFAALGHQLRAAA